VSFGFNLFVALSLPWLWLFGVKSFGVICFDLVVISFVEILWDGFVQEKQSFSEFVS
jgi:hypothetical protein